MDEKNFDDMMEKWAAREQSSAPRLRPTRDMYALLEGRRRTSRYPLMARWATVGAAVAVIVVIAVLHPSMVPVPLFKGEHISQEVVDDEDYARQTRNETKDPDAGLDRMIAQTSGSETQEMSGGAADKGKRGLPKQMDEDAEPMAMPADAPGAADARRITPETALAPPESPKSRAVTDFGAARGKTALQREEERLDADKEGLLKEEQKTPQLANRILGEQMAAIADCTPLPDASFSSPPNPSSTGRTSTAPAILSEISKEETGSGLLSGFPETPQICTIQMTEKQIGDKTFRFQEHIWIDTEYVETQKGLRIQRDSPAYTDILTRLPDMRVYAESGDHMIVSLKTIAIEIAPEGQTALTDDDISLLESISATQ